LRTSDRRRDRARLRLPPRDGRPRQLLRRQRELPRLRRHGELPQRRRRPGLRHLSEEQPEAARNRAGDDGARARDRALPQLAHPGLARLPGDRLLPVHPAGDRDRTRLLVPAAAERDAEHAPARRRPRRDRARLARLGARRDVLDRRSDRLAAARLRRRRLHGSAALAAAGGERGGAHRRRALVAAPAPRADPADPPDDRVLRRDRGDHRALVGLQLRLRADAGGPRLRLERARVLHLEQRLPERLDRGGVDRRGDPARDGEHPDRRLLPAARPAGAGMRTRVAAAVSRQAFLLLVCVGSLYPIWFMVSTALKHNQDYVLDPTGFPSHATFHNVWVALHDLPVPHWLLNSVIVTVSSVAIATLIAMLGAYAIVFGTFRGRGLLLKTNL